MFGKLKFLLRYAYFTIHRETLLANKSHKRFNSHIIADGTQIGSFFGQKSHRVFGIYTAAHIVTLLYSWHSLLTCGISLLGSFFKISIGM